MILLKHVICGIREYPQLRSIFIAYWTCRNDEKIQANDRWFKSW